MVRPVGRDSLVFEDIRLMVIAPARSAVVFYRAEFTFPLGVPGGAGVTGRAEQDRDFNVLDHKKT
jgi:hypothetical protein